MRYLLAGCFSCMCLLMAASAVIAQATGMEFDLQQRAVVRVESGAGTGSGLIVGVGADGKRLTIVTARHVIEGEEALRDEERIAVPDSTAKTYPKRRCRTIKQIVPKISYRFERGGNGEALSAFCTDQMDVAVLEVELDAGLQRSIPSFRRPSELSDATGNTVVVLGIPQGANWSRIPNARILLNDPEGQVLQLEAPGVQAGFSGGPVLDRFAALVGMVVREENPRAIAEPWSRIADLLRDWQLNANRLEGLPGESNPSFAKDSADAAEEAARNAVRQYQRAFADKDLYRMRAVYPSVVKPVQALFGDSVRSDLKLAACTRLVPLSEAESNALLERLQKDSNPENATPIFSIDCEFQVIVYRRTGPELRINSSKFPLKDGERNNRIHETPMTFYLTPALRESLWQIVYIEAPTK